MAKLFIMKGVTCSGKSTLANEISQKYNATIVSSDQINIEININTESNGRRVFDEIEKRTDALLKEDKNVIIDATNLTKKKTSRWVRVGKTYGAEITCVFVNIHPDIWERQAEKKVSDKIWEISINKLRRIKNEMIKALWLPSIEDGFNNIVFHNVDTEINEKDYYAFRDYYSVNKDILIENPRDFFNEIYKRGELEKIIPELHKCYNVDIDSKSESNIAEYIYDTACRINKKDEKTIWAIIIMGIAKVWSRIYNEKDILYWINTSITLGHLILSRLGFSQYFAMEVALTIQNKEFYENIYD